MIAPPPKRIEDASPGAAVVESQAREGRSDARIHRTIPRDTVSPGRDQGGSKKKTSVDVGMGDDSNGGGGEAAPQQKGRALAALGMVGGRPAAVLLAKLRPRDRPPVGFR